MERLTDKDWHKTKFMGLNDREVLHTLWEIENKLESGDAIELKPKWAILYGEANPHYSGDYAIKPLNILCEYYDGQWHYDYQNPIPWRNIVEEFDTEAAAESCLKKLQENDEHCEPPCKVGDTVYRVDYLPFGEIYEYKISKVYYEQGEFFVDCVDVSDEKYEFTHTPISDFCKTYQEAEKIIKDSREKTK